MASKDFTDDFLKILRSGFNTEDELDAALASAKQQYKDELEAKKKEETEKKAKENLISVLKSSMYNDYLRYLEKIYPDFKPTKETRKRFFNEIDFIDFAVGARVIGGIANSDVDNFINDIIKALRQRIRNSTPSNLIYFYLVLRESCSLASSVSVSRSESWFPQIYDKLNKK